MCNIDVILKIKMYFWLFFPNNHLLFLMWYLKNPSSRTSPMIFDFLKFRTIRDHREQLNMVSFICFLKFL